LGKKGEFNVSKRPEVRKKMRFAKIKWIENNKNNGLPMFPGFNKKACQIIENYGKENGYNFQHAMNGGEYFISELGYWVDGYDKDKNVVIEYYEPFHRNQLERDERRKQEIINYLNCDFIEIKEWE